MLSSPTKLCPRALPYCMLARRLTRGATSVKKKCLSEVRFHCTCTVCKVYTVYVYVKRKEVQRGISPVMKGKRAGGDGPPMFP